MQTLFGGSSSSSGPSAQTGFGSLPAAIQNAYTGLATTAGNTLNPGSSSGGAGTPASSLFTLPTLGTGATNALSSLQNQQYAVTPQSISSDINEQMNPFNGSVIGQIEQAQNGQESQLNQMLTSAGQFGSNRGIVGASDISNNAANQIGSFLDNQYNTSLQNALTTIPQAGMTSASGAVNAGLLQQQQAQQNNLAPVSALQALAQLTGVQPSNTSMSQQSQSSSSPGIL